MVNYIAESSLMVSQITQVFMIVNGVRIITLFKHLSFDVLRKLMVHVNMSVTVHKFFSNRFFQIRCRIIGDNRPFLFQDSLEFAQHNIFHTKKG